MQLGEKELELYPPNLLSPCRIFSKTDFPQDHSDQARPFPAWEMKAIVVPAIHRNSTMQTIPVVCSQAGGFLAEAEAVGWSWQRMPWIWAQEDLLCSVHVFLAKPQKLLWCSWSRKCEERKKNLLSCHSSHPLLLSFHKSSQHRFEKSFWNN